MRYLLVGNYGTGNLGDEALRQYFLQAFSEIDWQVLSANPQSNELPRLPAGFRSFFRFDWLQTLQALRKSDGLVFGGGSLFTDAESSYACWLWWCQAVWAWLFRKPIILAFQGIGPTNTFTGRLFARWVVRRARFVSVRDSFSLARVKEWRSDVVHSFDPVFYLMEAKAYDLSAQSNLVVIPRHNSGDSFIKEVQSLLQSGRWQQVICVSMQSGNKQERQFIICLRNKLNVPVKTLDVQSLSQLVESVASGSFVLAQRYHGALAALALGRELKVMPQQPEDKIASVQQIIADVPLHSRRDYLLNLVAEGESALRKNL